MFATEDWWSVWIGLALYCAGLAALGGVDLVGWMAAPDRKSTRLNSSH